MNCLFKITVCLSQLYPQLTTFYSLCGIFQWHYAFNHSMFWDSRCSTGLGLYARLQNGVDRVSRLVRVNESIDITNHRGACQPHRHEHHNKQVQYDCRQPCWRSPPIFGLYLLRPNGCMDQDVTWYGARPRPRRLCVRWGPSSLPQKGRTPNFRPTSIMAKRLHGSRCHWVRR